MIHICYNVNNRIFKGLLMSVMSVAKRASEEVYFHILSMDVPHLNESWRSLTETQLETMRDIIGRYNPDHKVEQIDCRYYYELYFADGRNQTSFYTPYAQLRLLLDLLKLDGNPDKILYLDADTMCLKDIKELYDVDVGKYEFAAVLDNAAKFWIDVDYCNSGVMLFNVNKIKETGLLEKTRQKVSKRTMFMPDQSALNDLVKNKLILPRKFNEQRKIREDTVIKHFCRVLKIYPFWLKILNYKQWQKDEIHNKLNIHEFDDIFEEIAELEKDYAIE